MARQIPSLPPRYLRNGSLSGTPISAPQVEVSPGGRRPLAHGQPEFEQDDETFKALADVRRRKILFLLSDGTPRSLIQLGRAFGMPRQLLTHHVAVLISARLVLVDRAGRERIHELNKEQLLVVDHFIKGFDRKNQ